MWALISLKGVCIHDWLHAALITGRRGPRVCNCDAVSEALLAKLLHIPVLGGAQSMCRPVGV